MKRIGFILLLGLLLGSCSKDLGEFTPEETEFKVYENKHIEYTSALVADSTLSYSYEIIDGYSRVFEVDYAREQYNNIYDDEYGEHLVFQIPTGLDTFFIENEGLIQANCFFNKWGAWASHYIYQIGKGEISGQRIDDKRWSVFIKLETSPILNEEPHFIEFEGIFVEEN